METGFSDRSKVRNGGVTVSYHNIWYQVEERLDDIPICGKKGLKDILKGCSGVLPPGLNAIMGPTGSGKTSLLDVLAMRKDPKGLKHGNVLLNGAERPPNFRLMNGYVVQDDIVMGTLTVRENLAFSANLRLSKKKFNEEMIQEKVQNVIEQLGLQDCADTMVGTELIRGVSGGERKRVNIGMEMILDPPILFLDEPTTGLDANTANSIVLLLYQLAKEGRNIILSIHQPRYSIFSLFDRLLILQKGEIAYQGLCKDAVTHFEAIGYKCPQYHNPADYFLDIVGGDVEMANFIGQLNSKNSISNDGYTNASFEMDSKTPGNGSNVSLQIKKSVEDLQLVNKFKDSPNAQREMTEVANIWNTYEKTHEGQEDTVTRYPSAEYQNSFISQMVTVNSRTFLNLIRNPMTSYALVGMNCIIGILVGLIYYQMDNTIPNGIQNRAGCFFFLIISQVMSNMSALEIFIARRKFFIHESASGYYRVSVYFLSQIFADLVPNRIIPQIFFSSIVYWMIGLSPYAGKFFFLILTLAMTALAASSLAFIVSATVDVFAIATVLVGIPYLLMMMFGGFLVNTSSYLDWLAWIKWISIFRYGINALTVNEMTGMVFINNASYPGFYPDSEYPCYSNVTHAPIPNCLTGEQYMEATGIPYGVWEMWSNIVALFVMFIVFQFLAYVQMRRVKKYK